MRRLIILLVAVLVLLAVLFIRQPLELRAPEITESDTETGYDWSSAPEYTLLLSWELH